MPFKDTITNQEVRDFMEVNHFYNLNSSVGYGCANKRSDVLLVQYFLNVQNKAWDWIFGKQIAVDGDFGGETWRAIKTFQNNIGYNGAGTVSTVRSNRYTSPKTNTFYTIIYLNDSVKHELSTYWTDLRRDPLLPHEIRVSLSSVLPEEK